MSDYKYETNPEVPYNTNPEVRETPVPAPDTDRTVRRAQAELLHTLKGMIVKLAVRLGSIVQKRRACPIYDHAAAERFREEVEKVSQELTVLGTILGINNVLD